VQQLPHWLQLAGKHWMAAQAAAAVYWARPCLLCQSQYQAEMPEIAGSDLDGRSMPQGLLLPELQARGMTAVLLKAKDCRYVVAWGCGTSDEHMWPANR
jgi:hypothetical protein